MKNVLIYGTGKGAEKFFARIKDSFHVIGFIVSSNKAEKNTFMDKTVWEISDVPSLIFDEIFIANEYSDTYFACIEHGIAKSKIKLVYFRCYFDVLDKLLAMEGPQYDHSIQPCHPIITRGLFYQTSFNVQNSYSHERDYVRYKLLELLAEQLISGQIQGSVAELGVYQENFAKYINTLFPDRKLYLFDTFEGFDTNDEQFDIEQGHTEQATFSHLDRFKNNSVELVLAKMSKPKQCVIRKGFFPDTAKDLDEVFSLAYSGKNSQSFRFYPIAA